MDPASATILTTAVTTLAAEVGKDFIAEGTKRAWTGIKSLLGWKTDPTPEQARAECQRRLTADDNLAHQVLVLLKQTEDNRILQLVGSIHAQKVVVAHKIDTVNM